MMIQIILNGADFTSRKGRIIMLFSFIIFLFYLLLLVDNNPSRILPLIGCLLPLFFILLFGLMTGKQPMNGESYVVYCCRPMPYPVRSTSEVRAKDMASGGITVSLSLSVPSSPHLRVLRGTAPRDGPEEMGVRWN